MVIMEWTPALSVGLDVIDEQHKKLFGYMNNLDDALTAGEERKVLVALFVKLEDYTHTHFKFEEDYFDKFHYDGKSAHLAQHQRFIADLADMKKKLSGSKEDAEDLLGFLVNWLMNHIKGTDHQYIACFREHGLK